MKIVRYMDSAGQVLYGERADDGAVTLIRGDIFGTWQATDEPADVRKLLAPVPPGVVLAIGANYRLHVEESGKDVPQHPVLFMKAPNAVQNPGDPILLPRALQSTQVDYEGELAVVIGTTCKNVERDRALDVVLGYTCMNDVSARDWQKDWGGSQWCRGKTFDTFAPLGPCLVTTDAIPDPNALAIRTVVNGEVMQDANTQQMIFDVPTLIEFLSGSTTLRAGTVIATGTPHGVGMARTPPRWLQPGDSVTVTIENIGDLTNPVVEESA